MNWRRGVAGFALAICLAGASLPAGAAGAQHLYQEHCVACHGESRLGGIGPALLPENLERLRTSEAVRVIREGRMATQMPAFGDKLSADQTQQLAEWIYHPATPAPVWEEAQIRSSHVVHANAVGLPATPGPGLKGADPLNLFVVVETGEIADLRTLARLMPHYGGQSWLVLEGGRVTSRGVWPLKPQRIELARPPASP